MSDKELRKQEKKRLKEERKKLFLNHKVSKKKSKIELKESIKKQKVEIVTLKNEYKKALTEFKTKDEFNHEEAEALKLEFYKNRVNIKNNILKEKFEFGGKYKTFSWQCLKWTYGIKKEFNRIVWSNTTNTFKYLGIIVLIIGILALLFFGIDSIVDTFR